MRVRRGVDAIHPGMQEQRLAGQGDCVRHLSFLAAWIAALALAAPASAERFVSAFAHRAGDRAELTVQACRSDDQGQGLDQNCGQFVYLEEVLEANAAGARVRVTMTTITAPNGQSVPASALGMDLPTLFQLDEAGSPLRVENRAEVMANAFALIRRQENGDPATLQTVRDMFERMDDASYAQLEGKYLTLLSMFQGIEIEVGAPFTAREEMPFPLAPSIAVIADARLSIDSIEGGIARASYSQTLDEASVLRAVEAFMVQIPNAQRDQMRGARIGRTVAISARIDVASGRTTDVTQVITTDTNAGGQRQLRVERVQLRRRALNP